MGKKISGNSKPTKSLIKTTNGFEIEESLPPTYRLILQHLFPKCESLKILDLGCGKGIAGRTFNKDKRHLFVGVDIFNPYLEMCKSSGYYSKLIKADLSKFDSAPKSYDIVILFQVIEHLEKNAAIRLLKKSFKIARKAVIVTTPNGVCEQESYDDNVHQTHLSAWYPTDLQKIGLKVYGQGLKSIYGTHSHGVKGEIKTWQKIAVPLGILLAPIVYFNPELSAQLIAVKYTE